MGLHLISWLVLSNGDMLIQRRPCAAYEWCLSVCGCNNAFATAPFPGDPLDIDRWGEPIASLKEAPRVKMSKSVLLMCLVLFKLSRGILQWSCLMDPGSLNAAALHLIYTRRDAILDWHCLDPCLSDLISEWKRCCQFKCLFGSRVLRSCVVIRYLPGETK